MKIRFKSFATRLSIYTLTFVIIIFAVIMALFYTYSREKMTDYAIERTHGLLKNMALQVNGLLETVEITVQQSVGLVEENLSKPDSLYKVVVNVVKSNDLIVGSAIAFRPSYYKSKGEFFMLHAFHDGEQVVSKRLGSVDYDYPYMDWYLLPKLLNKGYWSEPYYDQGGANIIMATYSYPLYDASGQFYAVFIANISLAQFTGMVDKLKPYESSYSFLLSRNGSYLTHQNREKIMNETVFSNAFESGSSGLEYIGREMIAGHTGTFAFREEGVPSFAFYTSIPNIGWSVCNICRQGVILHDLYASSRIIMYLFIAGVLLLFGFTYFVIKKLVRPLEDFSRAAQVIAAGHFDRELPVVDSSDEMKKLHDSFAYMQDSLSEYVAELRVTTAAKERIESELSIARDIQMGMIPKIFPPFPERHDVDLHAVLKPAKEVGGDLYDFFIEGNRLYFAIGDVSGKGVPASLFMAITRSLFRTLSSQMTSPAGIMVKMNNSVSENNESAMFVTLIIGILDLSTGVLKYCNAGHNPPVLIYPDGRVEFMKIKTNLFVGLMDKYEYVEEEITLEKGTKIFLYTDGVTEAENEKQELYSDQQLLDTLAGNASSDVRETVNAVLDSVVSHVKGADPSDDLTMLVIHYKFKSDTNGERD